MVEAANFKIGDRVTVEIEKGRQVSGAVFMKRTETTPLGVLADEDIWKFKQEEIQVLFKSDRETNRKAYIYDEGCKRVEPLAP